MRLNAIYGSLVFIGSATVAFAQPTVGVGNHALQPDQSGQSVQIFVSGIDAVEGLNLNAQINDGGSAGGGVDVGPTIEDVDLITGTIFATNHNGGDTPLAFPQLVAKNVLTNSDTVIADGLLATITLDTTGVFSGTYSLRLSDTLNGSTDFLGTPAIFASEPGTLTIVPEPAGGVLLGTLSFALLRRRRAIA